MLNFPPGCVRFSLASRRPARSPTDALQAVLDPELAARARAEMRSWRGYAPTPLIELPALAEWLGVSRVWCKDESARFGIGSFKALGGAYAVACVLQDEIEYRTGVRPAAEALVRREVPEAADFTTVTASAGNHGRAVAWGSERVGCRCVVVLPEGVESARAAAIAAHGAEVQRFSGTYDAAVKHVTRMAEKRGWLVVSDTAWSGYEDVPRRISEGYTLLADEMLQQLEAGAEPVPTHLFVQTGVGGLATGVCGHLWHALGAERPTFVAVEPLAWDCFSRSLRAGEPRRAAGGGDTPMGGLAAGVPSSLAWRLLSGCLDAGIAIPDAAARAAVVALATGRLGSIVTAGPSGAAGVGALLALGRAASARRLIGLDRSSAVSVLVTEGPI